MTNWDRQLNCVTRWAIALALLGGPRLSTVARAEPQSSLTTFIVTKTADTNDGACDADCSLREAIVAANAQPGADSVIVPAGIYTLTIPGAGEDAGATGDLDITDDLTLTGAGAEATVIDGGGIDKVVEITGTASVNLDDVAVTGASNIGFSAWGAISNSSHLTLLNTRIVSNTTTGIQNTLGTLTVVNSFVANNVRGGILNYGGIVSVVDSTISSNPQVGIQSQSALTTNGAVYGQLTIANSFITDHTINATAGLTVLGGVLTMTNSSVFSNSSPSAGMFLYYVVSANIMQSTFANNSSGAILDIGSVLTITNSLFTNNSTTTSQGGGALYAEVGNLAINNSTFTHNYAHYVGGAIAIMGTYPASINNSLFTDNVARFDGGAISSRSLVDFSNSTFFNNSAGRDGGGLHLKLDNHLNNVTVVSNTADSDADGVGDGGGVYFLQGMWLPVIGNSIVAGNTDLGGEAPDCGGTLTSLGYNLIQNPTGCVISGTLTGVITGTDPLLGPLQDNGGPTLTHVPLPGSPVIDTGNPAMPGSGSGACEVVDQRGYLRPVDGDGNSATICDIGAVEAGSAPGVAFTTNALTVNEAEALATLTVTLSATRTETITVDYATNDGTALAGSDYVTATGTLTFAPSATLMTFTVPIVEDMLDEPDESFTVTLSNPVNTLMGGADTLTLTIVDNDIEHRVYMPVLRR